MSASKTVLDAMLDYYLDEYPTPYEAMKAMRDDLNLAISKRGSNGFVLASDLEKAVILLLKDSNV